MLMNPYRDPPETLPGTRMLYEHFGLVGKEIADPIEPRREWRIHAFYAPLRGRVLGGLRARVVDQKGFTSFVNQRDLEVLLRVGRPGAMCPWLGKPYVAPGDPGWVGPSADDDDLEDDLRERELFLRAERAWLEAPLDLPRRVHADAGDDFEELHVLVRDTGNLASCAHHWARAERRWVRWDWV
jgi:hypothetical protein